jgi:hypothetical protein
MILILLGVILELQQESWYVTSWAQPLYGPICLSDLWYSVPPSSGENWGVVISSWTHHQTWWTLGPDRATGGLEITDQTPPFEPSWSTVFDRIVASYYCVASFFTDVVGLMMCSIWKDHPMTLIFVFNALKFLWWIIRFPSIEKILHILYFSVMNSII